MKMGRWFRMYDSVVDDPKVQRLPAPTFKAWVNLLCLASQNGGDLPQIADIAYKLRMTEQQAEKTISELKRAGLIDETDAGETPHNWNGRQFESDVSTARVKRHRERQRNVSSAVTRNLCETAGETPPDTEAETEQKRTDANASGAPVGTPFDARADLFGPKREALQAMTGKRDDQCRSLIGRWLKTARDDAVAVGAAIEQARRDRMADPIAWIEAKLKRAGPLGRSFQDDDEIYRSVVNAPR